MHKMTEVVVEIIEAMPLNAYNGVGDRRILRRSSRVHHVEDNSFGSSLEQKMDILAKQMKIIVRSKLEALSFSFSLIILQCQTCLIDVSFVLNIFRLGTCVI